MRELIKNLFWLIGGMFVVLLMILPLCAIIIFSSIRDMRQH